MKRDSENLIGICSDNEGGEVIAEFHSGRIAIRNNNRLINHPIENGTNIFDNKVIEPREITVTGYVRVGDTKTQDAINTMVRMKQYTFYSVVTGEASYLNMALQSSTINESTDRIDLLEYNLVFKEMIFCTTYKKVSGADDSQRVYVGVVGGSSK